MLAWFVCLFVGWFVRFFGQINQIVCCSDDFGRCPFQGSLEVIVVIVVIVFVFVVVVVVVVV